MLISFRCCFDFRHFLKFKKNYPFYPCLVVGVKRARYRSAPSWICFMLTECRFRYYVPVNVICSLPEFRFAQYVRKSALPTIRFLILRIILFPCWFSQNWLKLRRGLNLRKDRKRIKTSELVEDIVDFVFVGHAQPCLAMIVPCKYRCGKYNLEVHFNWTDGVIILGKTSLQANLNYFLKYWKKIKNHQ